MNKNKIFDETEEKNACVTWKIKDNQFHMRKKQHNNVKKNGIKYTQWWRQW